MNEKDIWRTAALMIKQFGDEAELQSSLRADQLLEGGDRDGELVWLCIIKAIQRLTHKAAEGTRH